MHHLRELRDAARHKRVKDPAPKPAKSASKKRSIGNLKFIWAFAMAYPAKIALALLALFFASGATLAIPYGLGVVVDQGFTNQGGDIGLGFRLLFGVVSVLAFATALRFYFVSWLGERVVADVRIAVQNNLLRLSPSYFEANRPSEITSRLTSDTAIVEQIVGTTLSVALRNFLTGILGTGYLFYLSPKLAGLLIVGIPIVILPLVFMGNKIRAVSRASQDRIAGVGSTANEILSAMKIVQAFGQERREASRIGDAAEATFTIAKRRITLRSIMTAAVIFLLFGSVVLILWEGAVDVQAGRMTGGAIASFVIAGGLVAGAFGSLTEVYGDLLRGAGAAERLGELLREEPEIKAPPFPVPLPEPAEGRVAFENVTFTYPTRRDVSALRDFSLTVRPGETLAVVGPSGAGKSTLFQLLQRFYDPDRGTVRLDGVTLPETDPKWVRQRMAMVPQETVIFASSARDNLRYGKWEADDAALWAAADAANASEFLKKLPDGLDTFLGEAGARLSGGQRQRIAIARAILRDAPILLLDEATSALDAESERLVQDALERLMARRTTIVIAHRLATVRAADRIIVMDDGRIVEEGTHDMLTRNGGLYARLAQLQFEGLAA
jgi:ATP-binding cassette, subfamily B, bacterial